MERKNDAGKAWWNTGHDARQQSYIQDLQLTLDIWLTTWPISSRSCFYEGEDGPYRSRAAGVAHGKIVEYLVAFESGNPMKRKIRCADNVSHEHRGKTEVSLQ